MSLSEDALIKHSIPADEVTEILFEVLEGVIQAMGDGHWEPSDQGDPDTLIEATVGVVGDNPGSMTVRVSEPTALTLAGLWASMHPSELDRQDACDTMSEFCNVLGGTAKTAVAIETSLNIPSVTVVPAGEVKPLEGGVLVTHELGDFIIQLNL